MVDRQHDNTGPNRARAGAPARQSLNIRIWIILPVVLMTGLGLTAIGVYQAQRFHADLDRSAFQLAKQAQAEWKANLQELAEQLNGRVQTVVHDPAVVQAWREGDVASLSALAEPRFQQWKQAYGVTHLYFIATDGICRFRAHRPSKQGDRIERFTYQEAQRTGEPVWGIELGKLGTFTLRFVQPWRVDGRLVGYVEAGMEIEHVSDALAKTLQAQVATFIKKAHTSEQQFAAGREVLGFVGNWDDDAHYVTTCRVAKAFPAEVLQQLQRNLSPTTADAAFVTREGASRYACVIAALSDAAGRDVARLVVVRDVTAVARAEWRALLAAHALISMLSVATLAVLWLVSGRAERELAAAFAALRDSQQHLAATLRSIGDGVISTDAAGNVTSLNTVAEALTGWRDADARGRSITEVFHIVNTASREEAANPVWAALAEDRAISLTNGTSLLARDGTERQIADSCAPIHDDSGAVAGAVLVFRDVTAEYRQREALRASEEKYRALVENANDIIYSLDQNGEFSYLSPNWTQQVGYGVHEGQGSNFRLYVHPDDVAKCSEFLRSVLETGEPQAGVEYRVRHKDGRWRWHRSNASALRDAAGRVIEYIGIARDVTDQKEAEEAVRLAKEEAEQNVVALQRVNLALERLRGMAESASRSKSEFLANMSHEIRTPITAILGYADILTDECECPAARQHAAVIKRNGEHLLGLINDILDLSKIEAGKLIPDCSPCSPRSVAAEVVSLMRVRAEEKHLNLRLDAADDLPESILTDPLRLRQILVNLVGNAVKFTDHGEVVLTVRRTAGDAGPLAFLVRDTGIGMTAEQLTALFRPFTQADSSATRKFGGTGLGLAISKRLAEALGGTIEVQSAPDAGSTFTLTINAEPFQPAAHGGAEDTHRDRPSQPAGPPDEAAAETSADTPADAGDRLPVRILLAEDGADNRRLLMFLLQKAGAEVTAVEDGLAAVEVAMAARYVKRPFDLILMDMQMPVMDGYAATRLLRDKNYRDPIVALTAHAMADDRCKCLDAGCDDYLSKPIERQRLIQMVHRWTHAQPRAQKEDLATK